MKFRYYITDTLEGVVQGTDDESVARDLAQSDDYFVVDTETGKWVVESGDISIDELEVESDKEASEDE